MSKKQESQTYQVMLDEVEGIIREVASPDLDLDAMVSKVERGYTLIKSMRERLDETKGKIEKLRAVILSDAAPS
jgi:exodeoxyribonuclease VII small subunit